MPEDEEPVSVTDDTRRHRYEAHVGDDLAGFITYRSGPGVIVLVHTEVDPAFEGHGVGGRLAAFALDDIAARGLQVDPMCPFVAAYIERHPHYAGLVAPR
ncbi:MAG: GNAT family N-acetyltransferase [Acidimicrobiales bacterium]|jgi:predicted GNAT family acetyltransferase